MGAAHLLTDGHHGYLTFLAVAAEHRRSGIARLLVEAAFRSSGAERIDLLSTSQSNPFYDSLPHTRFDGFRLYP
ncbi:acetyltransferase (GNAT) family protein [Kribbella orskensis]|uniref:Acetyltransferase (GNAT) family protein n=1 Tax=Kribbella orskensis TaxID=2512216 RepID=A0ABY2BIF4_9ACTN|nr:acetyltransferase (GNAT) family protein [Kribbella sp. VKM Ac-2500]TCO21088.1 acetyltransferase (GNAT) family protein [Kribbella orskensis]